ncbi:hypothetical protein [Staphylococcus hyicus]|nr:hypothetical protein [Staphylococcus hyicus]
MSVSSSVFEKSIVFKKLLPLNAVICFKVVVYVPSKPRPFSNVYTE